MELAFVGAELVDAGTRRTGRRLAIAGPRIIAVDHEHPRAGAAVDLGGFLVVPGFIDLHTHGGGGFALHTTEPDEIRAYARWVTRAGTTAFLVNIVGVPEGLPQRQLLAAVQAVTAHEEGALPLGIYLEGPFLNPSRRGAHHPSWLRLPDRALADRLLSLTGGHLRVVTLAPELPGALDILDRLVAAGVTVALGHTDATYEVARQAFARGARLLTHCFNAMPPLLHRAPGPIGALVESPKAFGELIADGHHVLPPVMRVLIRALGPERTVVVTDAQPGAGLPTGTTFAFAGLAARVDGDLARLADGTIAGSLLTMDRALRNLVELADVPIEQAVRMLSETPARALGLAHRKGRLVPGYDADFVVLDPSLRVHGTVCRGRVVYASPAFAERFVAAGIPLERDVEEPANAPGSSP